MRDKKRIREFCNRLATAWEKVPDWRFSQLFFNVVNTMYSDPFYVEDEDMIRIIEAVVDGWTKKEKELKSNGSRKE